MNLTILTGAGISAESGIPTFRDSNGLWHNHKVEEVASLKGYRKNPTLIHDFYNERRRDIVSVQPNAAHIALAKLEAAWTNYGFLLVTQNIDDLHERGGSKNIAHIHGEILKIKCSNDQCIHHEYVKRDTNENERCYLCKSPIRPDVVWFGEMPYHLDKLERVLDMTDIFISIGTSGQVMPASLFAAAVSMSNPSAEIIEVNMKATNDSAFNRVIIGPATETVPELVDELIARL